VSAAQLPGIFGTVEPLLRNYGYLAVAGVVGIESFGVPSPGETVLVAGAIYAGAGKLNVFAVGVIGFLAAVIGDNIGYLIGHTGGRAFVHRFGKYVLLTPERYEKAETWFTRHGGKVVVIARFVEGLRQANGIIAGASGMPWLKFLTFQSIGAALWVGLWTTLGYYAGQNITTVYETVNRYSTYALFALIAVIALVVVRHVVRRRRRAASANES